MTVVRKNKHLIAFFTSIYAPLYCSFANKHDSFDTNVSETIVLFFCIKNYDTDDYSSVTLTFIIWYFFEESFATQDLYAYGSLD